MNDPDLAWIIGGAVALVLVPLSIARMRILDRYVGALYVAAFLVAGTMICGLYVVIDLTEKFDSILKTQGVSVPRFLLRYYACRLPLFVTRLLPMVSLVATMITIVRLSRSNEFVPMLLAGRSAFRVLSPAALAMGAVIAGSMAVDEWVLPPLAIQFQVTESQLGRGRFQEREHLRDREDALWFYNKYSFRSRTMTDVLVRKERGGMTWRARASLARWDGSRSGWLLSDGVAWTVDSRGRLVEVDRGGGDTDPKRRLVADARQFATDGLFVPSSLTPEEVEQADTPFLPLAELAQQALDRPGEPSLLVQFHNRLAFPLYNLILPALGLPFMLRRDVRSMMLGVGVCLLIGLGFFAVHIFFLNLGNKGDLNPVAAAWAPVVLFTALALWLFEGVRT